MPAGAAFKVRSECQAASYQPCTDDGHDDPWSKIGQRCLREGLHSTHVSESASYTGACWTAQGPASASVRDRYALSGNTRMRALPAQATFGGA
jgi:hypothetical protein